MKDGRKSCDIRARQTIDAETYAAAGGEVDCRCVPSPAGGACVGGVWV